MKKLISIFTMDKALLFKLITEGVFPLSLSMTLDGMDYGKALNYFEDEDGLIVGTTKIPEPPVLIQLYVIATKPIPKYPHGTSTSAIVGEHHPGLIFPNGDMEKPPIGFKVNDPDGNLYKELSKMKNQPATLDISPDMMKHTLEIMDSERVKGCLDEWVQQEWFEYAAVAKKILDERNQL